MTTKKTHIRFTGIVTSGRNLAKKHLREEPDVEKNLGVTLFPGSMNVLLTKPMKMNLQTAIITPKRAIQPCQINGVPAYAHRWPDCPLHVCEILHPEKLRDKLGLKDGDRVTITFDKSAIERVDWATTWAWLLFWKGREKTYYTDDDRPRRLEIFPSSGLALQDNVVLDWQIPFARRVKNKLLRMIKGQKSLDDDHDTQKP